MKRRFTRERSAGQDFRSADERTRCCNLLK